jgi:hypothetical protein
MTKDSYETQKEAQLARRRRVIFNNDGGDSRCDSAEVTSFLEKRTTPLAESSVDTISYCTGITGVFSHRTTVGDVFARCEERKENKAPDFIEQGTDTLQMQIDFCREHGKEIFWSLRMNDIHDAGREWMFNNNTLKTEHPEYLLRERGEPGIGGWSAFDYARDAVRNFIFRLVEEVCQKYDVDGIELDFFRHPVFFKRTSSGLPVTHEDRNGMTDLMRSISDMVEKKGRKRGRPFLVAARTPDDVDYCNTIGLEIERWMEEGLIDIHIPSGYIKLTSWEHSVRLGHEHDVEVYPGLSESRVGGGHHANRLRASDECYRARALNAWEAGADGVYIFNLFDPHRQIWKEMGEPERLQGLDTIHFASVRGVGHVAGGAYPHQHFINVPTVNPDAPLPMEPGERVAVHIPSGKRPDAGIEEESPEITLRLQFQPFPDDIDDMMVVVNGRELGIMQESPWITCALDPECVRAGSNTVELMYHGECEELDLADIMLAFNHSGELLQNTSYVGRTRENM